MTVESRNRRRFLATALGATAAAVVSDEWLRPASAQPPAANAQPATALTAVPLRADLTLITGAGSNVVVLRGATAAAIVDSGPPERATELAALVRANSARYRSRRC